MNEYRTPQRLRWRCRRGLKELDVLLEAFVGNGLDGYPAPKLPALERFLELQDQELLARLLAADAYSSAIAEVDEHIETARLIRQRSGPVHRN